MSYLFTYKTLLLVIITLRSRINLSQIQKQKWIDLCKDDVRLCNDCFSTENFTRLTEVACDEAFDLYEFSDESFVNTFNSLFGDRDVEFASSGTKKVVIKRLADRDDIDNTLKELNIEDLNSSSGESELKQLFLGENRVGGSFICHPNVTIENFYQTLPVKLKHRKLFWLLMNFNIQPLIFTAFDKTDLPIPKQLDLIGLISITENKGRSLVNYFSSNFMTRLKISKLLLEGILNLTNSELLKGYKIYLTDLTLDNIVYDSNLDLISFVDLDNIILIDSLTFSGHKTKQTHVHEKIECNGCFAYSIEDICSCPVSDINVFAVCQLLYEDLYEDRNKGFLHSIPERIKHEHPQILVELEQCVNCKQRNCDRFKSASTLLQIFDKILNNDEKYK